MAFKYRKFRFVSRWSRIVG